MSVPDTELLSDFVRHGKRDALEALLVRHTDSAYRLALRMCGNSADAEEIVQSAFLSVIQSASTYRNASTVKGWIMTIVANAARNRIRRESARRVRELKVVHEPIARVEDDSRALRDELLQLVGKLPEHYRMPVYLRYLEDLSFHEVATTLALPERTVRTQVSRGLEQLREMLNIKGRMVECSALASMLAALPLEHAPASLATSVQLISKTATAVTSGTGIAEPAAALKGTALPISVGWKIGVVTLLGILGVVSITWRSTQRLPVNQPKVSTGQDQPVAGESASGQSPDFIEHLTPELKTILDKKIYAIYRNDHLADVLLDLKRRAGLNCVATVSQKYDVRVVTPIQNFPFNFESKSASVKDVLQALFNAGGLTPECHDTTIVLWKKTEDREINDLIRRARSPDGIVRRIAVRELGARSDPRIFSELIVALKDDNEDVYQEAVFGLYAQSAVLPFVDDAKKSVPALIKAWERIRPEQSSAHSGVSGIELSMVSVLAATHDPRVVGALLPVFRDVNDLRSSSAMDALSTFDDPRIVKEALALPKSNDWSKRLATLRILAFSKEEAAQAAYTAALQSGGSIEKSADLTASLEKRDVERILEIYRKGDARTLEFASFHLNEIYDARLLDELLNAAAHGSDQLRSSAIMALGGFRDERVATRLLELLPAQTGAVRITLIEALGKIADGRAAAPLARLASHADKDLAPKLAFALSRIGGKVCDEALWTLLNNAETRRDTASALVSEPSANTFCASALSTGDKTVRLALINAAVSPADGNWATLFAPLLNDPDPEIKDAAEKACARLYVFGSRDSFFDSLIQSNDPAKRIHAADLLSLAHDYSVSQPIFLLMKDPDVNVRRAAVCAFCRSGDLAMERHTRLFPKGPSLESTRIGLEVDGAEAGLIAALSDNDAMVQNTAATILAGNFNMRKVELLRPLLKSEKSRVRILALKSLGILVKAVELVTFASDPNPGIRAAAAEAMQPASVVTPEDVALMAPLLRSLDQSVKLSTIRCLSQSGVDSASDLLIPLLDDHDVVIKKCAIEALGRSSFEKAFRAAGRFVKGMDPELQEIAIKALLQNDNLVAVDRALALLLDPDKSTQVAVRNAIKEVLAEHQKSGRSSIGEDKLQKALENSIAAPVSQDF